MFFCYNFIGDSMNKEKIIVSACLLGKNCKYNGGNNFNENVNEFLKNKEVIAVCPEVMGGMSIPRLKSEIKGNNVINENSEDVSECFFKGAIKAFEIALENDVKIAILKEKSPSCGSKKIYDGNFNGTVISGSGIFAKMLINRGIKVLSEEDFKDE